jgi:hypothetical protein
MASLGHPKHF